MGVLRDAMARGPYRERLKGRLWGELRGADPGDRRILPVASVLAAYDREGSGWREVGDKVAGALVRSKLEDLSSWREALESVRPWLLRRMTAIFRESLPDHVDHEKATEILIHYAADRADVLVDLLLDAEPKDFSGFLEVVKGGGEAFLVPLREAMADADPPRGEDRSRAMTEAIRQAKRRARAAVALIRLGQDGRLDELLVHGPDPEARGQLITAMAAYGVPPRALADDLERLAAGGPTPASAAPRGSRNDYLFDPATSRCRALILALAKYPRESMSFDGFPGLTRTLARLHREHPDAGVHSAAELALRNWDRRDLLSTAPGPPLAAGQPIERRWYVNREGQTMILIDGPVEFDMGSPLSDPTRDETEYHRRCRIPRRFAIAAKEVSLAEFRRFTQAKGREDHRVEDKYACPPDGPLIDVTFRQAAEYCDWLSDREGLPRCYGPNVREAYRDGMRIDAHGAAAGGYRLPTEAEWEYACRARTATIRYFGDSPDLLGHYEWYQENAGPRAGYRTRRCGLLLPNDLGLFDMLGNVMEWCHDRFPEVPGAAPGVVEDAIRDDVVARENRNVRGGAFGQPENGLRSASRKWAPSTELGSDLGFRVARTLP
jgi:formylglycine-generating enzyme required for sulfatase activity